MSVINDHVRMGESMAVVNPIRRMRGFSNLGRIRMGYGIAPAGIAPAAAAPVQPTDLVAGLGGGALLLGSSYVDGPASAVMAVLGALGLGYAGYSIFSRMTSPPAAPARPVAPTPTKPAGPYGVPAAQFTQAAQALAPTLKTLFAPSTTPTGGVKPANAPAAPSSYGADQAGFVTSLPSEGYTPTPSSVAPPPGASDSGFVTSLSPSSSGAAAPSSDSGFVTDLSQES